MAEKENRVSRGNNFNLLRFTAAWFVFAGHQAIIMGIDPPRFAGFRLHDIGVDILFLIGGYLISKSWSSDPHPVRYAVKRFFRLWIPFAVMILIFTFVTGPLLSELGPAGYFNSWYGIYLKNLRLFVVYAQPGVFTKLPYPNVTNGSLWTMPVEAAFYVLTPFLLGRNRNPEKMLRITAAVTAVICAADLIIRAFFPDLFVVFYGTDLVSSLHLLVFYLIGTLYAQKNARVSKNPQTAAVLLAVQIAVQFFAKPIRYLLLFLTLPELVFSFALAPDAKFGAFGKRYELSYGIYLYGFIFQQLVMQIAQWFHFPKSYPVMLLLAAAPTVAAAFFSCILVEQPSMKLSKKFR